LIARSPFEEPLGGQHGSRARACVGFFVARRAPRTNHPPPFASRMVLISLGVYLSPAWWKLKS
jgi:hypothetical protein